MTAEQLRKQLQKTSAQQDRTLQDRFNRADNVLLKPKEESAVIRDTFSLPPDDYALIESVRAVARRADRDTTKSEVIRAGLHALTVMDAHQLIVVLNRLKKVKPGRKS